MSKKKALGLPPNIRLKKGATPATISGRAFVGTRKAPLRFPSLEKQETGWHSLHPTEIHRAYPDRYELIKEGAKNA